MIFLCSVFRDSESYIDRYVNQVGELRKALSPTALHTISVEGDSTDDTFAKLLSHLDLDTVLKAEHGGKRYPSIDDPIRWRQISVACNVALCAAARMSNPGDMTIYVESDLVWDAETMVKLTHDLWVYPAVATMSMQGERFYDTWGHVKDGIPFQPYAPFYPGYPDVTEIDSAGSCFALTHEALQVAEFSAVDCIRGVGRSLRNHDFQLWLDPGLAVHHP